MGLASWIERRKIPYPMELLRLLRLGEYSRQKDSQQQADKHKNFSTHAFSPALLLLAARCLLLTVI
jgi:hypothetical protein